MVAAEDTSAQCECLGSRRADRHNQNMVDIRIAGEDADGIGEHEDFDVGIRPGGTNATDERRCQEHIAEATQRDYEDPGTWRKIRPRKIHLGCRFGLEFGLFCATRADFAALPLAPEDGMKKRLYSALASNSEQCYAPSGVLGSVIGN
jgi:hypothetical protein